ncbi:MAG: bifunctional folylpolyglutamate synthase/dihydrofolate synthase [bacterium]|nr:bifunctional folylpolyglutamate synthase/dihydrofolate synthase [bacterium]
MLDKKQITPAAPLLTEWTYSPVPALEQAVNAIRLRHIPLAPTGLAPTLRMLERLGNPHLKLPPVFHVAGTNGKGSSLAFLQAIFEAGGLTVHKFISPHLVRFEERIMIAGKLIEPDHLLDLIAECEKATRDEPVSFFEFFTCLAFLAWSRSKADAVLLETGLGGLFDATNVVEKSVAVLTRISFDHTRLLGNTLPEIAAQKAGIIKHGCPVVIAPQAGEGVLDVFLEKAKSENAGVSLAGRDWTIADHGDTFRYEGKIFKGDLPRPQLIGAHQVINAGTAIAAVENSAFSHLATAHILSRAMKEVEWQGRFQQLKKGSLAALLPKDWELWVDGAHNDSGAEVLVEQATAWGPEKPLHIITGFKRKKEPDTFYLKFAGLPRTITAVDGQIDAPMVSAAELCDYLAKSGFADARPAPNLESAIQSLAFQFATPQRIIITGSLYLVGHALKINNA